MPELNYIQTYEEFDGVDFQPTLGKFCKVLKSIDLWNEEIKTAFDNFELNVRKDVDIYTAIDELGYYKSKLSEVKIRPLVMVYSNAFDNALQNNWICCELFLETANLRDGVGGKYYSHSCDLIKSLSFEMQKEFKQTGIYFTDEFQDGFDFDGISCNDHNKLWRFDYALIPLTLEKLYSEKPATHKIIRLENYIEAWHAERWNCVISH